MAKPTIRDEAVLDAILERLSDGEPLAQICRGEGMPATSTLWDWRRGDESLEKRFANARAEGHDMIVARARATARGKTAADGGESTGDVQRDKLIVDFDLKLLAKWDPKRWGDRMTHSGDAENPIHTVTSFKLAPLE